MAVLAALAVALPIVCLTLVVEEVVAAELLLLVSVPFLEQ
jgi:hypothetical protein